MYVNTHNTVCIQVGFHGFVHYYISVITIYIVITNEKKKISMIIKIE